MKCPLQHEASDESFSEGRILERIVVLVCPKCGIVFAPKSDLSLTLENPLSKAKQILKWP